MGTSGYISLKEATYLVMEKLGVPEGVDNFNGIYRPLLDAVNNNKVPALKRGRRNLVDPKDIESYTQKLKDRLKKEKESLIFHETNDGKIKMNYKLLESNCQSSLQDIKSLIELYEKNIIPVEQAMESIHNIMEKWNFNK